VRYLIMRKYKKAIMEVSGLGIMIVGGVVEDRTAIISSENEKERSNE